MSTIYKSVDVLVVGAGLSGIGGACQLQRHSPDKSFTIFEARSASGGTWDLFRYPGIRSDSDMFTYAYGFKPWTDKSSIADGHKILSYIREAAQDYDIERHIHYRHKVISAVWSSADKHWVVSALKTDTDETVVISCKFIFNCTGYYDYDEAYWPDFAGADKFAGRLIHAQHWPEDLDYAGKRVIVVGSGATAVTLVPSMAKKTSHMVMLQRSPTYIAAVPEEQPIAKKLRRFLPPTWVSRLTRWKQVLFQIYVYHISRKKPRRMRRFLLNGVREQLDPDYDIKKHFTPNYNPWDQRLCAARDGDLFAAIREGRAEIVTDHIECFNKTGIQLKSGTQLDADIIVLATGLKLKFAGGIDYQLDGKSIDFKHHYVYRGMMFSDIPNMAFTVGYTNSSWTLKAELTGKYVSRLLNQMQKTGSAMVTPRLKGDIQEVPLLDFEAGYVLRSKDQFPKQGDRLPWKNDQNYIKDFIGLRLKSLKDDELEFHQ